MNIPFNSELIDMNASFENQTELFEKMFVELSENNYVNEGFLEGILEREKKYPTGLDLGDYGVAIPHTDIEYVKEPFVYVVTLQNPIDFSKMDDSSEKIRVKTIFLLGLNTSEGQLNILKQLMPFIQDKEAIFNLHKMQTTEEVLAFLQKSL